MDDPGGVRRHQCAGDLAGNLQHLEQLHALLHALSQSASVDELHRDEFRVFKTTDFMNRQNVRMIERRGGFCFLNKSLQSLGIRGQSGRQNLDRDGAIKFGIFGEEHLAHAAFANLCADFITAEFGSSGNCHGSAVTNPSRNAARKMVYLKSRNRTTSSVCGPYEMISCLPSGVQTKS